MSEPSCPAEGRLKAGCSQDWLSHQAAHIFIICEGFPLLTIFVDNEYYEVVAGKLQREIHQTKAIRCPEEEAALNVVRTADVLMLALGDVLKPHLLSATQYNVLRILRGAGDQGASCKDIGSPLLTRDPDITRLMDRLEERGLVTRDRAD